MGKIRIYVVESIAACNAVLEKEPAGSTKFVSSSPAVLDYLEEKNIQNESIEKNVDFSRINQLARAGYDFAFELLEQLNRECEWRNYIDLKLCLAFGLNNTFYPIFYKACLLDTLMKHSGGSSLFCVGNPKLQDIKGLKLLYGWFDNLYACLASHTDVQSIQLKVHEDGQERQKELIQYSYFRKMGVSEKILSILNNTPSSFFAKLYNNLRVKKIYRFSHLSLNPFTSGKTVYINRDCEHIDEIFLGLLKRGVKIGKMPELPVCRSTEGMQTLPEADRWREMILTLCEEKVKQRELEYTPLFRTASEIVADRILSVVGNLKSDMLYLDNIFKKIDSRMEKDGLIFTNALTSPEARAFYCYCRQNGRKVVAFEHGLVYGLSKWDSWCAKHAGMLPADTGVYHTEAAARTIAPYCKDQKQVIGGLPMITSRMPFPLLQRYLSRKWLNIKNDAHVIFYVAELERNNFVYGPHMENDYLQVKRLYQSIKLIRRSFPESKIVLKLYPSARYLDRKTYIELEEVENIILAVDMDFRFIRSAADLIFLSSAQSTLGWCLGTGKPVMFVEPEHSPVKFSGLDATINHFPEIKGIKYLNMDHIARPAKYDDRFYEEILS